MYRHNSKMSQMGCPDGLEVGLKEGCTRPQSCQAASPQWLEGAGHSWGGEVRNKKNHSGGWEEASPGCGALQAAGRSWACVRAGGKTQARQDHAWVGTFRVAPSSAWKVNYADERSHRQIDWAVS